MTTAAPALAGPSASTHRLRRLISRAVDSLTTPMVSADLLDSLAPLRAGAELSARVLEVRHETEKAVSIVLRPGRSWAGHVPGQYARIGVEVNGVRLWRSYSITSAPVTGHDHDARLAITVAHLRGGAVSPVLQQLRPGDLLHLDQALGDFVIARECNSESSGGPLLFVTGGSGITPVMGMIRSGLLDRPGIDVVLLHSARTSSEVIFGDELRALADRGALRLIERHTADEGRLTPADLVDAVPDARTRELYLCGPAGLVSTIETAWTAMALGDRVHTEVFHTPVVATGHGGTAVFERAGVEVWTEPGESLLDAGEKAGVDLPFGCRQGLCFRCVRPLIEGSVRDLRTGEETHAVPGDGVSVQTCISSAAGQCRIDA